MISGSRASWAEKSKSGWPAFLTLHLHVQPACRKSFRIYTDEEEDQTGLFAMVRIIRFSLMAAFVFGPLVIPGQQLKVGEQVDSGDAVFSAETRLVPLNVTVTDKSGRLVTNLPQSAFQVFENGVLQTIRLFKREDVPVSMGLIIDNSGSMREKRQASKRPLWRWSRTPILRMKSSS